jgi:plastocyanin
MKVKGAPFRRISFRALCLAAGGLMWCGSVVSGLAAVAKVNIEDDFFSPATSSINAGDSVVWTWVGTDGHNVTSESKPTAVWKASPTTFPPFSFTNTFPSAGTFPYECTIHAFEGMLGTIKVAAVVATPPTVSITSPASGSMFTAPATVSVAATAADSGGTINDVQFLIDASPISDANTAPYQAVANNVAAGTHTLTAIATAGNGLKATNNVTIQVNAPVSNPPTVSITAPASGALLAAPATVNITATAADSGGTISGVQFSIDASPISTATTAPYQAVANNVAAGTHTITAIATAGDGLTATNSVTIQVFTPVMVSAPTILEPGSFQFSYSADLNSSYVVQRSTDLINWVSIDTNSATANPETFTDDNAPSNGAYYRVELLANP